MKFLLIAFAFIGLAVAQILDSATQGPNPQDIATPEPEYIDIDVPEPPAASASASAAAPAPIPIIAPVPFVMPRPFIAPAPQPVRQSYVAPQRSYIAPVQQLLSGHSYSSQSGYQYRRPVFIRRVYRRRRY